MKCIWLNMTDSTNALAARCRKEAEHLTVWSAEYQSEGKGQRGNKWESADKKSNLFNPRKTHSAQGKQPICHISDSLFGSCGVSEDKRGGG